MKMTDNTENMHFNLVVIGGGSAGMAAAKQAAKLGATVCIFNHVSASPQGTTWGLGGTCVNAGCVPKKLMHYAGTLGESFADARTYGWDPEDVKMDYEKLITNITCYIRKLNFGYRKGLRACNITYLNAKASLTENSKSNGEIAYSQGDEKSLVYGDKILIAIGGRPIIPADVPGAREFAITSDDIFWRKQSPGKTLCVGASYIGLECASFIHGLGFDTTVCVRSILLRGFDRQCSEKIGEVMTERGVKFIQGALPSLIAKVEGQGHPYEVQFTDGSKEFYDTILYATGRSTDFKEIALNESEIELLNNKIKVDDTFATSVPTIFAVGDIHHKSLELTPTAIAEAELVTTQLFGSESQISQVNKALDCVATTVFTCTEYGCVGLDEEKAMEKYGEDDIEVYHQEFETLEYSGSHRLKVESCREDEYDSEASSSCLAKVITMRGGDEKVLGIHFVGPNAGEVIQGFAVAMRTGVLTKSHLDGTIGIHPTAAEVFTLLDITKRSGEDYKAGSGCGGGKCG